MNRTFLILLFAAAAAACAVAEPRRSVMTATNGETILSHSNLAVRGSLSISNNLVVGGTNVMAAIAAAGGGGVASNLVSVSGKTSLVALAPALNLPVVDLLNGQFSQVRFIDGSTNGNAPGATNYVSIALNGMGYVDAVSNGVGRRAWAVARREFCDTNGVPVFTFRSSNEFWGAVGAAAWASNINAAGFDITNLTGAGTGHIRGTPTQSQFSVQTLLIGFTNAQAEFYGDGGVGLHGAGADIAMSSDGVVFIGNGQFHRLELYPGTEPGAELHIAGGGGNNTIEMGYSTGSSSHRINLVSDLHTFQVRNAGGGEDNEITLSLSHNGLAIKAGISEAQVLRVGLDGVLYIGDADEPSFTGVVTNGAQILTFTNGLLKSVQ
jgi:hypothetical protein